MLGFLKAAVGTVWIALAGDVAVESALNDDHTLRSFGRAFATVSPKAETIAIAGLAFTVGAVAIFGVSAGRRARRWHGLKDQTDRRWKEFTESHSGLEARNELLQWRVPELQRQVDELDRRRDEKLEELAQIAEQTQALYALAGEGREALQRMKDSLVVLPDPEPPEAPPAPEAQEATKPEPA